MTVRAFSDREVPKAKTQTRFCFLHLLPDMTSAGCVDGKETHQAGMLRAGFTGVGCGGVRSGALETFEDSLEIGENRK